MINSYIILIILTFSIIPLNYLSSILPSPESFRMMSFIVIFLPLIILYLKRKQAIINKKTFLIYWPILLFLTYIIINTGTNINKFYLADTLKLIYILIISFIIIELWQPGYKNYPFVLSKIITILFGLFLLDIVFTTIILKPISPESGLNIVSGITGRAFTAYNGVFFIIFGLYLSDIKKRK